MPKGVYVKKLGVHGKYKRTPETLAKLSDSVRVIAQANAKDPEWRKNVSEATKERMRDPDVRERHLAGLKRAQESKPFGAPFSGSYDPNPNALEHSYAWLLSIGYVAQFVVIKGKRGEHYTLDYALPSEKIDIEIDGTSHKHKIGSDAERDRVLKSLGWKVIRVRHWS